MSHKILIRISGIFAIFGGFLYILIQAIHPADVLASVSTTRWAVVAGMTCLMSISILIGLQGYYQQQVEASGLLGLIGYGFFGTFWLLSAGFSFVEATVLPLLVESSPDFVSSMVGIFGQSESTFDLGIFPLLANLSGIFYILGGILLGLASAKAGVFPKWAGSLLALAALATIGAGLIGHPYDRLFALPMGLAMMVNGFLLLQAKPGKEVQ